MRRLALIAFILGAVVTAVLGTGASGGEPKSYRVRAIFDDAAFVAPGEDVRIAGANVGSIKSLDVTADKKAAVTLEIDDMRFAPFFSNASCAIRLQSLIGEKYVNCNPGTSNAPPLTMIRSGPGAGAAYLPVTRTSSPIDSDIVQDISTQPVRESLATIIDEFGTGLAARGSDLNAVIHRANPALGYTDQVFRILARQNRQLAQLATDSDAVLAPLARARHQLSDFIAQANTTSVASAARANDISRSIQLFPGFLRQLRPLLVDLQALADQGTPLMAELGQSASAVGRQFQNLTPFAKAARPALINLGTSAARSQPALLESMPLAQRLRKLGNATLPTANLLDRLTSSIDQTGGIENLMRLLFFGTTATNGYDKFGHYVRTETIASGCVPYSSTNLGSMCTAMFPFLPSASVRGVPFDPSLLSGAASATSAGTRPTAGVKRVVSKAVRAAADSQPGARLKSLLAYLVRSH